MILQTVKNMEYLNIYPKAPLMAFSVVRNLTKLSHSGKGKGFIAKNNYPQYCWET